MTEKCKKTSRSKHSDGAGAYSSQRSNLQLTNSRDKEEDSFSTTASTTTNEVAYMLVKRDKVSTAYQDLTRHFPVKSFQGKEYVLVSYNYDANSTLGVAIKSRTANNIPNTWEELHNTYAQQGVQPTTYVLDKDFSKIFTDALTRKRVEYQMVTPHFHCSNLAKSAISIYEDHFKTWLDSCGPKYPIREWDRLIPQANITMNLLQNTRINPALLADAYLYEVFDFAPTPLAPPGTNIVAHVDKNAR